jgi:hypothetical protein
MQHRNDPQDLPRYTVRAVGGGSRLVADDPASRQSATRAGRANVLGGILGGVTFLGVFAALLVAAAATGAWLFTTRTPGTLGAPFGAQTISFWDYVGEARGPILGLSWFATLAIAVCLAGVAGALRHTFVDRARGERSGNNGWYEVPWSPSDLEALPLVDGRDATDVLFAAGRAGILEEGISRVRREERDARDAWAAQALAEAAQHAALKPAIDDVIESVPPRASGNPRPGTRRPS